MCIFSFVYGISSRRESLSGGYWYQEEADFDASQEMERVTTYNKLQGHAVSCSHNVSSAHQKKAPTSNKLISSTLYYDITMAWPLLFTSQVSL